MEKDLENSYFGRLRVVFLPQINWGGRKFPDKETAKVTVMVLLSDELAMVTFVLLRLTNAEWLTGTSFEGAWSKFTSRSGGMFHFSTALSMPYKYRYSSSFLASSRISTVDGVFALLTPPIRFRNDFAHVSVILILSNDSSLSNSTLAVEIVILLEITPPRLPTCLI